MLDSQGEFVPINGGVSCTAQSTGMRFSS